MELYVKWIFLKIILFVECLCYNNNIIILPDNMKAGGMFYETMALSDRGGGTIPVPTFRNGMMPIQTDSTLWYGSVKGATGNGKYGLIDTTGQYVSRNDFDQIEWRDSRYMGKRGGRESVVESPWSTLTIYNNEGLLSVIISN